MLGLRQGRIIKLKKGTNPFPFLLLHLLLQMYGNSYFHQKLPGSFPNYFTFNEKNEHEPT